MQNQLESCQKEYLNKQDEAQDQFIVKEHQFEQKIQELTNQTASLKEKTIVSIKTPTKR